MGNKFDLKVLNFHSYYFNNLIISASSDSGFTIGANLFTVFQSDDTKNFVKFHFIASVPKTPFELSFKNLYKG